jgi:predicted Rossmann fold flavoprotein
VTTARTEIDIAVIGAGAAGLMAAVFAGRTLGPQSRVVAFDGARTLGAKVLVAGGGRCNVTHHRVDESAYAGSSRNAIKKVLRRFDVPQTVAFFESLGVTLKREDTGKLFPTTDSARTVLDALLRAVKSTGAEIVHPWRVARVVRDEGLANGGGFLIHPADATLEPLQARRVILCTGGKSLPKSGSDGLGHAIAKSLGHSITPRVFPALVPLLLPQGHVLTTLSGLTLPATLELRSKTGKRLVSFTNSTLCTHFGLSGPSVLDISRYYTDEMPEGGRLFINFLTDSTPEALDRDLQFLGKQTVLRFFAGKVPERMVRALCDFAKVDTSATGASLTRDQRRALVAAFAEHELPITGDRGWNYAEVTAGGVPLDEVHLDTMESRLCPGLHLAGEVLDVDGRIGGFNFQWAWASGFVAGTSAAARLYLESEAGTAKPADARTKA